MHFDSKMNLRGWDLGAKKMSDSSALKWQIIVRKEESIKNRYELHTKNLSKPKSSSRIEYIEIKPCGFECRIWDMEAESYNWSHFSVSV